MKDKKLALLFALQERPLAPSANLASEVGITPPTARAWLESLYKNQVYRGVRANLRVKRIGLEMDDFLVRVTSFESLKLLERFCDAHPYTSYRARVYGGDTHGMLLQFRQPDSARDYLVEALRVMEKEGIISSVREVPTLSTEYGSTYTRPRLRNWDPERMTWHFDWETWWKKPVASRVKQSEDDGQDGQFAFDIVDAKLMQELTMNARRKNVDIIRAIGMDPDARGIQQEISSRLARIKKEVVESYRVFINWTHFDVYNTALVVARADKGPSRQLVNHLRGGEFPFGSSIRLTPDGFVWSARLPSAHLSELISLVWRISRGFELLLIDYKHSETYGLWHEAFDESNASWRVDREFCYDMPMNEIGI